MHGHSDPFDQICFSSLLQPSELADTNSESRVFQECVSFAGLSPPLEDNYNKKTVSSSDIIALIFGLASTVLGVFAVVYTRNNRIMSSRSPSTSPIIENLAGANNHSARAKETSSGTHRVVLPASLGT
jgi:hypothetical protein